MLSFISKQLHAGEDKYWEYPCFLGPTHKVTRTILLKIFFLGLQTSFFAKTHFTAPKNQFNISKKYSGHKIFNFSNNEALDISKPRFSVAVNL